MKKFLALVLFTALFLGLALPASAVATIVLPDAPKADIVIDGVRDDGYGEMFEVKSYRDGGSGTGATAKVWAAWNETGVFYYLEVNDTTPNHDHGNSYERDCVEFFIDWNAAVPDGNSADDDDPSWQLRIASAPNEDGNTNSATLGDDNGLEDKYFIIKPLVGDNLNGGYIMEVCLPISYTNGAAKPLAEGRTLYVDFQIADNEEDEGRSSQAFLDGEDDQVDSQWSTPEAFMGILNLVAAKPAPVVEDDAPAADDGGNVGGDDAVVVTPPPSSGGAAQTGDSGLILLVLAIALSGAVVTFKRVGKNRA